MRTRPPASRSRPVITGLSSGELVAGWNSSTYNNVPALAASLTVRGASATALATNLPTDAKIAEAVAAAGTLDLTAVLTSKAWDAAVSDPGGRQQALVRALVATGRPVVVVAVPVAIPTADLSTVLHPFGHGLHWTVR